MKVLTRRQLIMSFLALMLLRMSIGYHFFSEGATKLRDGGFDSGPFLSQAVGPFSEYYHNMLDDYDGHWRLCIRDKNEHGKPIEPVIDTRITFAIWDDFASQATKYYQLGDPLLIEVLQSRMEEAVGEDKNRLVEHLRLIQQQPRELKQIIDRHRQQLEYLLVESELEILAYAKSKDRLVGFRRDGEGREAVKRNVDSLREQINQIKSERSKESRQWYNAIEAIWNSLELSINDLPIDDVQPKGNLVLHRPFELQYSVQKIVNQIIPWFDTIIGGLLLIGLFTRFSSLLAAAFLISVVASQPFWVAEAQDTWFQWIELTGLLVIFATCAGRFGGLDYFLHRLFGKRSAMEQPNET